MKRMIVVSGLVVAAMAVVPTALMAAAGIDGAGSVGTCPSTGKISLKPPLAGFPNPDTTPQGTVKVQTCNGKGIKKISFGAAGTSTVTIN